MPSKTVKDKTEFEVAKKLRVVYSDDPEYKSHYVTGARGGPQGPYHFNIEFFRDTSQRGFDEEIVVPGKSIKRIDESDLLTIDRRIIVGVMLSYQAARELADWLSRTLKKYEEILAEVKEKYDADK